MAFSSTAVTASRARRRSTSIPHTLDSAGGFVTNLDELIGAVDSPAIPAKTPITLEEEEEEEAPKASTSTIQRPLKRRRVEPSTSDITKKARTAIRLASKSTEIVNETAIASGPLVDVSATLQTLERDTMGATWYKALQPEFKKAYFGKLKSFLKIETNAGTVYPALPDIYSWSRLTPLDDVRVVIIGQDPYHDLNQAHGLAFSVLPPTKAPPSLKNIFKQIQTEYPSFIVPSTGDLTPLAKRGVLFLNTCLTVRAHKAHSHAKRGWEELTTAALRAVAQRESEVHKGVVFMAWGLPAQKTCAAVGIDKKKHLLLKSAHPSPLSAYRGFFGNGHFKRANDWLEERYGDGGGVDWTSLTRAT